MNDDEPTGDVRGRDVDAHDADGGDDVDATTPFDPDAAPAALVPAGSGSPVEEFRRQQAAVVHYLEQSSRDAAANRAQARELIKALDQVRASHEYLGSALRRERRRGRFLMLGLVLLPAIAAMVVWAVWDRVDQVREELAADVDGLRETQHRNQRSDLVAAHAARVAALDDDLARTRSDLDAAKSALLAERAGAVTREEKLQGRVDALERERGEIAGLRARLDVLRQRAGAESARSEDLERELRELERALGAARARLEVGVGRPATPRRPERQPATAPASTAGVPPPAPSGTNGAEPARQPAEPFPEAVRGAEDLDRIRGALNRLLEGADDAVRYTFEEVGGVSGVSLLDVRLAGLDERGRPIRKLEAKRAQLTVSEQKGNIRIDLADGHLLLGGHEAPFFEGRYSLVVSGSPAVWRESGLSCVSFE